MTFADLGLSDELLRAVDDSGYPEPTPIQRAAIPSVLMGKDLIGIAQTGTGKTAGFVLPMIDILHHGRSRARMPRSLILEGLQGIFRNLFASRGQLLAFDDWHKAEPRAIELVETLFHPGFLADRRGRGGVVLALAYQPARLADNERAYRIVQRLTGLVRPLNIQLEPLQAEDAGKIVASMAAVECPSGPVVDWLYQKTEGQP